MNRFPSRGIAAIGATLAGGAPGVLVPAAAVGFRFTPEIVFALARGPGGDTGTRDILAPPCVASALAMLSRGQS